MYIDTIRDVMVPKGNNIHCFFVRVTMLACFIIQGKKVVFSSILMLALFSICDAHSRFAETFIITATAGPGGTITPSGEVVVKKDGRKTFNIAADEGYDILDVLVDGESMGPITKYEFRKVKSDHTIEALFIIRTYTITPTAGANGSIAPSEATIVNYGTDLEFTITPDPGYRIEDVWIDEESVGAVTSYTFTDISTDHSIAATFISTMEVLHVAFPNESMKIGDVIPVTITVENDVGNPYTFISGSVGGYPLEGFQRITATTYGLNFTINQEGNSYTASEDIPVSNLVISNGVELSAPYNLPVIQSGDPLDAELPVISSMQVAGGVRKVGDVIDLVIEADGLNYRIDGFSSINGIAVTEPNISFTETGGGTYVLSYTVQEGDTDVGPDASELQASVILIKPSDNIGMPFSTVTNASNLIIDAHAPVVLRMDVLTLEVGVGGMVTVAVTADGTGYTGETGTVVNGVPVDSPRVTMTELSGGLYELSYLVSTEDNAVAPGELLVSIAMMDAAGNVGNIFITLEPNNLEIYTDLPEAVLEGIPEICEGEEVELRLNLTGRPPWSFDLYDGDTTVSYTGITLLVYNIIQKRIGNPTASGQASHLRGLSSSAGIGRQLPAGWQLRDAKGTL